MGGDSDIDVVVVGGIDVDDGDGGDHGCGDVVDGVNDSDLDLVFDDGGGDVEVESVVVDDGGDDRGVCLDVDDGDVGVVDGDDKHVDGVGEDLIEDNCDGLIVVNGEDVGDGGGDDGDDGDVVHEYVVGEDEDIDELG